MRKGVEGLMYAEIPKMRVNTRVAKGLTQKKEIHDICSNARILVPVAKMRGALRMQMLRMQNHKHLRMGRGCQVAGKDAWRELGAKVSCDQWGEIYAKMQSHGFLL